MVSVWDCLCTLGLLECLGLVLIQTQELVSERSNCSTLFHKNRTFSLFLHNSPLHHVIGHSVNIFPSTLLCSLMSQCYATNNELVHVHVDVNPEEVGYVIERTFLMISVCIVLLVQRLWSADSAVELGWSVHVLRDWRSAVHVIMWPTSSDVNQQSSNSLTNCSTNSCDSGTVLLNVDSKFMTKVLILAFCWRMFMIDWLKN